MHIKPIKTHKVVHGDTLCGLLSTYIKNVTEGCVLAVTSKVLSILEGQFVPQDTIDKKHLVTQEADWILQTDSMHKGSAQHDFQLTIKDGLLIPAAGIDTSNAQGNYILYPKDSQQTAEEIWRTLRTQHAVQRLGVIVTDSRTTILRRGVTGVALAWCGLAPLYSYIGQADLDGRPLQVTQMNVVDALATAAVLAMGEGSEQTPFALIENPPHTVFQDHAPTKAEQNTVTITPEEDLYGPILQTAIWQKGTPSKN